MKITIRVLSIILSLALLAGCGPAATPAPTATTTPVPTATVTLTPTITPTATPTLKITPALPEISVEIQKYLEGFDSYEIGTVYGVIPAIIVNVNGEKYSVMVAEEGEWVGYYKDMSKCVRENGTFDMETAAKVFRIRVEDGKFNFEDYANFTKEMMEFYKLMGKSQLGVAEFIRIDSGREFPLTNDYELDIDFNDGPLPVVIGVCSGPNEERLVSLATKDGVVTFSYLAGAGIGYTHNANDESVEANLKILAANSNHAPGYAKFMIAMASTRELNPNANFTLGSPTMLERYWQLAGASGLSFFEFSNLGYFKRNGDYIDMSGLDQPLCAYNGYAVLIDSTNK